MPRSEQLVLPPHDAILVAAGTVAADVTLDPRCRGLIIGTAGTVNANFKEGENEDGTAVLGPDRDGLPLVQGVNHGFFAQIRTGGTAQNIWQII